MGNNSSYDFDLSVSIKQVLDADSAKQVEKQVEKTRKKLEEPIKLKVNTTDVQKTIERLQTQLTNLKSAKTANKQGLAGLSVDTDLEAISGILDQDKRIDAQIKNTESELRGIKKQLTAYKAELKAERGTSRKLTDEEKEVDRLLGAATIKKDATKASAVADAAVADTKKQVAANEELADSNEKVVKSYEKVEGAQANAAKAMSSKEMKALFANTGIDDYLKSLNIGKEYVDEIKQSFIELAQVQQGLLSGQASPDDYNKKFRSIAETLSSHASLEMPVEPIYQEFYDWMNGRKILVNDSYASEFSDSWPKVMQQFSRVLTKKSVNGSASSVDQIFEELKVAFPQFFSDDVVNEADQLKLILDTISNARAERNSKNTKSYPIRADQLASDVLDISQQVAANMESASSAKAEADAMDAVGDKAKKAAKSKKDFTAANKELQPATDTSSDKIEEESEEMADMAVQAEKTAAEVDGAWDKITTNQDGDLVSRSKTREADNKAAQTIRESYGLNEEGELVITGVTTTDNFGSFSKVVDKENAALAKMEAQVRSIGTDNVDASFNQKLQEYRAQIEKIADLRDKIETASTPEEADSLSKQFADASMKAEELRQGLSGVLKESTKLSQLDSSRILDTKQFKLDEITDSKAALQQFADGIKDCKIQTTGFNEDGTKLYGVINQADGSIQKVTIALDKATGKMVAFTGSAKQGSQTWSAFKSGIGGVAKDLMRYGSMLFGFHEIISQFRKGVQYVRDIDAAMTELRKVTDETEATYAKFLQTASSSAGAIGSTVKDFTTVTSDFARLGYSIEEASEMARTALIYENVGD